MSHHHHHHHHQPPPPPPPPPCCCTCINTSSCCPSSNSNWCCSSNSTPNPISPSPSTSDLLLHTLLLLQPQPQPQPDRTPRHRLHPHPKHHRRQDDHDADPSLHLLLHSLTRRVAALESSLSNISSSPPPPQKQPQQKPVQSPLKHAAAATIQRCFRRLLARRSRTLRDLKHLASVKSHAAALRSSLHDRKHPKALSHRAMDLLFQLDSIQSSDPMIREGKRSVSKELVRISEFVDKVLLIREEKEEDELEEMERTHDRARRVRFAVEENGVGDHNVFDELLERNPEEAAGEEEEEAQGFYGPVIKNDRFANGGSWTLNGGLGLAAPLPVKMEPRRTVMIKKVANEED